MASFPGQRAGGVPQAQVFDFYIGPNGSDANTGSANSPWAITTLTQGNPNQTRIQGRRIGLLDGGFDVSGFPASSFATVLLIPPGLSPSLPTYIASVNPLGAKILGKSAGGVRNANPLLGSGANGSGSSNPASSFITVANLEVTGGAGSAVSFSSDNGPQTNLIVDGCLIHDFVNPSNASNIGGVIFGSSCRGSLVNNSHIFDVFTNPASGTLRNQHGNSSAVHDWGVDTTVQFCTLHDCNNLMYQKTQIVVPPPQGATFTNNYCWFGNSGTGDTLAGFDQTPQKAPPYHALTVSNNVFENLIGLYGDENANDQFYATVNLVNNTQYCTGVGGLGGWIMSQAGVTAGMLVNVFNNILDAATPDSERGSLTLGTLLGQYGTCNFNRYPGNALFGRTSSWSLLPSTLVGLASFRLGTGTPDLNSVTTPMVYVGGTPVAGGGAAQYKLAPGSGGIGQGQGGVDMGAWGGSSRPSRIGSTI